MHTLVNCWHLQLDLAVCDTKESHRLENNVTVHSIQCAPFWAVTVKDLLFKNTDFLNVKHKNKKLLETLSTRQLKMSTRCHVNLQSQLSLKNVFFVCWTVKGLVNFYQGIVVFLCWTSSGYRTVLFSLPHSLWSEYRMLCLTTRIHQQQYRLRLPLFLFFQNWKKEKKNLGLLGAAVIGFRNVIFFFSLLS